MTSPVANEMLDAGLRAHRAGRLHEAAQFYEAALRHHAGSVAALTNLGLLRADLKEYDRAEELLRRALAAAPRSVDAHGSLAAVLHDARRFDEAIDICEAGLKLAPDDPRLLNTLASSLSGTGRYNDALALLDRMIKAHPRFGKACHFAGTIHAALGDCDAAVAAFTRATEIDPSDAASFVAAAECLMVHRQAEAALGPLERALALNAWDVRALALKTLALAEMGRKEEERWLADPARLVSTVRLADLGYTAEQIDMLNRALSAFASNEPSLREDPPEYSTKKAWHSTVNLADTDNEAIDVLKRFIGYAFEQRLKALPQDDPSHPFVRSAPTKFRIDLWAVKMASGGTLMPHIHPDGWLSGVYYVDVPPVVDDPAANHAGWLKLGSPRADIKLTREPITRLVKPEPGLIVTFPSFLWHDTVPLPETNTEQRLCLAFDVQPVRR
jgi:tetratricopeptide (TPR) repeat protein